MFIEIFAAASSARDVTAVVPAGMHDALRAALARGTSFFSLQSGERVDITRKEWSFQLTPSIVTRVPGSLQGSRMPAPVRIADPFMCSTRAR